MSYDIKVLRVLVRLVRTGELPDTAALALRAGGSPADVRAALARLVVAGLVDRTPRRVAPTLAGLCVAVASAAGRSHRAKPLRLRVAAQRRYAA